MAVPVSELRGMTDDLADKLQAQGLRDSDQYLEATANPAQRKTLATQLGVATRDVLELANRADLARVKGVGGVYSDLLEHAGVDTVKELATRRPDNLHAKILAVNEDKQLTERPPTAANVEDWVAQAKELPKTLTY